MSRILFLSNHFITLYSFRKELISELTKEGHEVYISTPKDEQNVFFKNLGCKIIETEVSRRGMNPFKDSKLIFSYLKIIKSVKPDIIFSYTIKPNIYGAVASNLLKVKQVCNITGTGGTFLQDSLLSKLCRILYKISVKHSYKVFFQNSGDRDYFIKNKMIKDNYHLLPGSGCNVDEHPYTEIVKNPNIKFLFVGRVMKLKGIEEYLECARVIKEKYPDTIFYIAGWNEEEKYKKIVEEYQNKGIVEYIGFRKDVDEWMKKCDCIILPSHGGEGIPNALLEASCIGRPCIASNINGSKDVVTDNVTGYIFEPGNAEDLTNKVDKFINLSFEERVLMGKAGHEKIKNNFNRRIVIDTYKNEIKGE